MEYLTDQRDKILCGLTPMLMQPRFGSLPPLAVNGRRYISAADGIYVETKSAVLHVCLLVTPCTLPYGELTPFVDMLHGKPDAELLSQCVADAQADCPNEWAGLILHDKNGYRYERPQPQSAGAGHITYGNTHDDEQLIMDLHSHGVGASYFSSTDDADDMANPVPVFIAGVIGRCDSEIPTVCFRLVVGGEFFEITWNPFAEHG